MHGHSFERICTKFRVWHRYTLQMVIGVSERLSSLRERVRIGRRNGSRREGGTLVYIYIYNVPDDWIT